MKIIESQSAVLSNAEVLAHLRSTSALRRSQAPRNKVPALKSPNFETVAKELGEYLHGPRSPLPSYETAVNPEAVREVMKQLEKFKFTKAELIMIINLIPELPSDLDAIIEECDERLSLEEQGEVLQIVTKCLAAQEEVQEGEGAGANN